METITQHWASPPGHLGFVTWIERAVRSPRCHPWLCTCRRSSSSFCASVCRSMEWGEQRLLTPPEHFPISAAHTGTRQPGPGQIGLTQPARLVTCTCQMALACFGISLPHALPLRGIWVSAASSRRSCPACPHGPGGPAQRGARPASRGAVAWAGGLPPPREAAPSCGTRAGGVSQEGAGTCAGSGGFCPK